MSSEQIQARISELVTGLVPQARTEAYRVYTRAPHALELDELEALALTGLAQAAARWEAYCAEKGHDPGALEYFRAYCLRRMRGAIADWLRAQDWVPRSARTRAKALRAAGQDQGKSEQELADATGLSTREVRDTIAAVAARPVSIDAEPHDVADTVDVEGAAVVSSVLGAVDAVVAALPEHVQELMALRYYHGWPLAEASSAIGVEESEGVRLHADAILAIHDAMVKAVA